MLLYKLNVKKLKTLRVSTKYRVGFECIKQFVLLQKNILIESNIIKFKYCTFSGGA